jgi:hypothetical protein
VPSLIVRHLKAGCIPSWFGSIQFLTVIASELTALFPVIPSSPASTPR